MNENSQVKVISKIISAQSEVIGPIAYDLAHNVGGLQFGDRNTISAVSGDYKNVLAELVKQYSQLFGQSSIEICKDALHSVDPPLDKNLLPDELVATS